MRLKTRSLGKSDLRITKVGVGTAPIGSTPEWRIYLGPQDEKIAVKTIQTAIDLGVNWIDTAPFLWLGKSRANCWKGDQGTTRPSPHLHKMRDSSRRQGWMV